MSGATLTMTTCLTSVAFIPALCNPFYFYQLSQKGKFKLKKAEETKFDISFCYIKMKLSKQMTGTARGFRFGGGGGRAGERWVHSGPVMAEHTTGIRGHAPPENFKFRCP